jgi:hypothetical protein
MAEIHARLRLDRTTPSARGRLAGAVATFVRRRHPRVAEVHCVLRRSVFRKQTTNLGVRSSNLFGRARKIKQLIETLGRGNLSQQSHSNHSSSARACGPAMGKTLVRVVDRLLTRYVRRVLSMSQSHQV